MTFAELDRLEKETCKKQSKNLSGIITSEENVIVCLGEYKRVLWYDTVSYFVLTDFRVLADCIGFVNIMLDKIVRVENKRNLDGHTLYVGLPEYSAEPVGGAAFSENGVNYYRVYFTKSDAAYSKWLTDELNKRISEAKIRLRSNTVNVKIAGQDENSIAGQLEKLASLYHSGAITQSEYNKAKEKLLS